MKRTIPTASQEIASSKILLNVFIKGSLGSSRSNIFFNNEIEKYFHNFLLTNFQDLPTLI